MATLYITRGLPGCGKTTRARAWVAEDPAGRARVNRDDMRTMFQGGRLAAAEQEMQVTAARDAAVSALLKRGVDVVCDDTSLPQRYARDLLRLAALAGAGFEVWDLTDLPLDECLRRNELRAGTPAYVPAEVIRAMWTKYVAPRAGRPMPPVGDPPGTAPAGTPYTPSTGAATAVMVDIDGTAAIMCGRSPYDESRVHEDRPNRAVVEAVRAMHAAGHEIIYCSGRTDGCREATEKWLAEHVGVPYAGLFMRTSGDSRRDSIVKRELFDRHVREHWDVVFVLDDRRQVVDAWREIGLTVFQVAPGDF